MLISETGVSEDEYTFTAGPTVSRDEEGNLVYTSKNVSKTTETPTSLTVKKQWLASDGTTDVSSKYSDKTVKFDVYQVAATTSQAQNSGETQSMLIAIYDRQRNVRYVSEIYGHLGTQSAYVDIPVGAQVNVTFTPTTDLDRLSASYVQATKSKDGNAGTLSFTVAQGTSYAYLYNDNTDVGWDSFDCKVTIGSTTVSSATKYLENQELTSEGNWSWTKTDLPGTVTNGSSTTIYSYYVKEVDNGGTDTIVSGLSEVPLTGGEITIKNVEKPSTPDPVPGTEPTPEIRKYVEKLSGEGSNDDYDLTLTVKSDSNVPSGKLDIIFVVDTTYSMTYNQLDHGQTRSWDGITTAVADLVTKFDASDVDVQYALTRFWSYQSNYSPQDPYKDSEVVQTYTDSKETLMSALNGLTLDNATNYDAAFYTLGNSGLLTGGRTDAPKLVIFISDGYPNIYYDANGYDVADTHYVGGRYPDSENAAFARLSGISGMNGFYALGVSDGVGQDVLNTLVTYAAAENKGAFLCNDTQAIKNAFDTILATYTSTKLKNVSVVDTLSDYAQPAGSTAKLQITVKKADGTVVGQSTGGTIANGATLVLDKTDKNSSDTAADRTLTATYDSTTKQVKLVFPSDYELESGWNYQITITIEPTLAAYEYYRTNGEYPSTGDADTDVVAGTSVTSSEKSGFYSNSSAKLYYNDKDMDYPKPVIQTLLTKIQLLKIDSFSKAALSGVKFSLYRQAQTGDSGTTTISVNDTETSVVSVATESITDDNGLINFDKLIPGTYYLEETEAPENYTGISGFYVFTVTVDDYDKNNPDNWKLIVTNHGDDKGCTFSEWDSTNQLYKLTVPNTMTGGYALPNTGGPGTTLFTIIGCILTAGAGILLAMRRRREMI